MKTTKLFSFVFSFFLTAIAANAYTDYWFVGYNSSTDNYSNINNWCNAWNGTPIGNLPSDVTDARINFQTSNLVIDIPDVEIATSFLFFADKNATVSGNPITVKNLLITPTEGDPYIVNNVTLVNQVTWGTNGGGKIVINSEMILKSISSDTKLKYTVTSGNKNDVTINGNITVLAEKLENDKYSVFDDDLLRLSWGKGYTNQSEVGTGNIILNGKIDLTRNIGYASVARVQMSGRDSSVKATSNPYAVLGGDEANIISNFKIENSANLVLAKKNEATAANMIESRGNNAVTFIYNQQLKDSSQLRAMNARSNLSFGGDTTWAHTGLLLRLNGTQQAVYNISIEQDQYGSGSVIEKGTHQYVQIDFAKGYYSEVGSNNQDSVLVLTSQSHALTLDKNTCVTTAGVRLETDEAKLANRENAIKSGLLLVNFNYENGDRIYFASDKVLLADAKYYDDISLISTDLIDHIWLAEGEKNVDYILSLEQEQGNPLYSLVVTYIPESSTYALVLATLALGLFIYRRNNS